MSNDKPEALDIEAAMRRAFSLGQTYWQQADSESFSQNRRADETLDKFARLCAETDEQFRTALAARDAEIAAMRVDAERYRWLRENGKGGMYVYEEGWALDALIDQNMQDAALSAKDAK